MLEKANASAELVDNGHKAVERALAEEFDLIFMDMQMPLMGGEEATRLIRHAGIDTPVIAVTANVMSEDLERYRQAGCQGLLPKPVIQADLLAILTKYGSGITLQADTLAQQLASDPQMLALKQQFTAQLPQLLTELEQHFNALRWRDLAYAAHSLKGSAGSMGYLELTELAGKLERSANKQLPGESETLLGAMAQIISRHVPAAQ